MGGRSSQLGARCEGVTWADRQSLRWRWASIVKVGDLTSGPGMRSGACSPPSLPVPGTFAALDPSPHSGLLLCDSIFQQCRGHIGLRCLASPAVE